MAKSNLIFPVDTLRGKITKKSKTIFRRKSAYDENGNIIGQCAQESYVVENPRDWKKNPPKGAHRNIIPLIDRFCKHLFKIFKEIFKFVDILFKIPIAFFGFGNIAQKKQVKIVLKVESGFKFFGKSPNTYLH